MMSEIVKKMQQEIINRSNNFEEQTKGTKAEYNIYIEHIQYVYKYVCLLSKNKNVDHEVLELSALLHDIAMTDRTLDRSRHNEYGSEIAEQLLKENNYPEDKIQFVKKCILNHSSKRAEFRTTEEERILVDADGLSHFDSINNLYNLAHNVMELNDDDTIKFIQDKLTRDYNEISDELKYLIQDKYDRVMGANSIEEILGRKDKYICKIPTLDEMNTKWDYEIAKATDDKDNWIKWKRENIERFQKGFIIPYYGILNGTIICECTALLNDSIVQNADGLVGEKTAYLSAFRTNEEYQGHGYFSILFKYMIEDLKSRGYEKVTLGVEPEEEKNKAIYNKYGFTEHIKDAQEVYPDGTTIDVEYYGKSIK